MNDDDIYQQSMAAGRDDSNTSIYAIDLDGDNDKANLVTACWECNLKKRAKKISEDQIQSITDKIEKLRWDGLCSLYPKLLKKDDGWSRLINKFYKA